jgi:hypothetical protein
MQNIWKIYWHKNMCVVKSNSQNCEVLSFFSCLCWLYSHNIASVIIKISIFLPLKKQKCHITSCILCLLTFIRSHFTRLLFYKYANKNLQDSIHIGVLLSQLSDRELNLQIQLMVQSHQKQIIITNQRLYHLQFNSYCLSVWQTLYFRK